MDAREEIKRGLLLLTQMASESDSDTIKKDIDLLIGVTLQLVAQLSSRNAQLSKQCRKRSAKAPKASPQRASQQRKQRQSSSDKQATQDRAEAQPQTKSHIMRGAYQADSSLADEQRALRQQIYGQQNRDVAFAKAAKAIAS
ncbi:MAG: hypothetical protein O9296_09280 [Novosphingobium sp.]|nr:hypothetical protein [Novosphingobium sp.]